jgi:hypothetical protein
VETFPEVPLPKGIVAMVTEQLDAFVELHEIVADELYGMGLTTEEEMEAVGAGGATQLLPFQVLPAAHTPIAVM